eukprot:640795-Prymnesium_polylepis.1
MYWVALLVKYLSDLLGIDQLPIAKAETMPLYTYLSNAVTLGTARPVLIQVANFLYFHFPWSA